MKLSLYVAVYKELRQKRRQMKILRNEIDKLDDRCQTLFEYGYLDLLMPEEIAMKYREMYWEVSQARRKKIHEYLMLKQLVTL